MLQFLVSNQFMELYALTQAARSYALMFRLIQSIMAMPCSLCVYLMLMDVTGHDKVFQASPPLYLHTGTNQMLAAKGWE